MKLITVVVAAAIAFSSTAAFAQQQQPVEKADKEQKVRIQPNNGNPNGNPNGPTTLSGTGSSQYGGSSAGTSGKN